MSKHASFLYFIYLLFLHPNVFAQAQQSSLSTPFLVVWLAHNLLITLPTSSPAFLFQFELKITFQPVHFFTYIHTFFSLNMSQYVSFRFMFHVPHLIARLSRAIQHIFRRLAGTQYTDSITCLANTHFVLVCTNYPNFASLLTFMSLNISVCVSFPMFHVFPSQRAPIDPAV